MGIFGNLFGRKNIVSRSAQRATKRRTASSRTDNASRKNPSQPESSTSSGLREVMRQERVIDEQISRAFTRAETHKASVLKAKTHAFEKKKVRAEKKARVAEKQTIAKQAATAKKKATETQRPAKTILRSSLKQNEKGSAKKSEMVYLQTYVPGFDALIDPGIPEGSAVLVEGGPGSGKTLFCLTCLRGQCLRGKKVLYMSFEEPEERLREHIRSFGVDAEALEEKGLLYLKRFNALDIARSVEALLSEAKKELLIDVSPVLIPKDFQPDIVLIDSLTSISSAFSGESSRFRIYMEQLFRYLENHKITSFLVREVIAPSHIGGALPEREEAVSFLSDGIIAIYNVFYRSGVRKRAIEVIKMRGVAIDQKIVEYTITGKGVVIHPNKIIKGDYKLT